MTYKAFQDFYHEESIKHLLVHKHNDCLISPPFATEQCKDYSDIMVIDKDLNVRYIHLGLPLATSKFNACVSIGESVWFIPYGIWDDFNIVVQIKDFVPIYHYINKTGRGQFYSVASDGNTAFSFPLGYEETSYGIYIKDDTVCTIDFDKKEHTKLHMGTVFCNGKYWSAPRSDSPGYTSLMSFDGTQLQSYTIDVKDPSITRKYTDITVVGNTLYAIPYGETKGMTEVLEFDTETNSYTLHDLDIPDFAKKFNVSVLVGHVIVALPYGDEYENDSNWGLVYNTLTKEYHTFDIGLSFGGKYRYRCGISYKGNAVFFPTGTPTCPILVIDTQGNIIKKQEVTNSLLGRPVLFNGKIVTMAYNFDTKENYIFTLDLE